MSCLTWAPFVISWELLSLWAYERSMQAQFWDGQSQVLGLDIAPCPSLRSTPSFLICQCSNAVHFHRAPQKQPIFTPAPKRMQPVHISHTSSTRGPDLDKHRSCSWFLNIECWRSHLVFFLSIIRGKFWCNQSYGFSKIKYVQKKFLNISSLTQMTFFLISLKNGGEGEQGRGNTILAYFATIFLLVNDFSKK